MVSTTYTLKQFPKKLEIEHVLNVMIYITEYDSTDIPDAPLYR